MVMSDSSDDDGLAVPPPSSTEMPLSAVVVGAETRGRRRTHEATAAVPESAWTTLAPTARMTTAVPETAWVMPVVAAEATS
jgi:hypothetical protein